MIYWFIKINNVFRICLFLDGIDFYYATQPDAKKLVDFLVSAAPCRLESILFRLEINSQIKWSLIIFSFFRFDTSKRLISHDIHSNTYNYKYTYSVEIAPICKVRK